jgi:hypothetical protein
VLYQADASTGFDDWTKAAGWKTVNGMLVNDGSSDTVVFVAAPFDPTVPDYAVEIEMQWLRERTEYSTAGVVARGGSETGYWAGLLGPACNRDGAIMLWSGEVLPDPQTCNRSMEVAIEGSAIERDSEWHTYRIEVTGNVIRVMVDDIVVIETSDNRFLSTGQVGVWSTNAQVNIRRLTVIALGS